MSLDGIIRVIGSEPADADDMFGTQAPILAFVPGDRLAAQPQLRHAVRHLEGDAAQTLDVQLAAAIQAEVEALEKRSKTEQTRWDKEKERLEAALRRARG